MCFNRENNSCCCTISIISALIGALGITGIYYGSFLTGITTIVFITLILGILGILYVIIPALCGNNSCNSTNGLCLIPISVGAIISSAFALAITFVGAALSLVPIVIAVAFFMILLLINLVCIIIKALSRN